MKNVEMTHEPVINDDDFTDEELRAIYGLDLAMGERMLMEDHTEHELERMHAWG